MKYYRDHLSDFTRPYPETEAGLALLKSLGIPLVVITNKNEILAVELLKQLGLADYFSLILGGDSLPEKKPSPLPPASQNQNWKIWLRAENPTPAKTTNCAKRWTC